MTDKFRRNAMLVKKIHFKVDTKKKLKDRKFIN